VIAYFLVGSFRGKEKEENKEGSNKNKQRSANYRKKSVLNGIVHVSVYSPGPPYLPSRIKAGFFAADGTCFHEFVKCC
jgi:hypothetical protein